MNAVPCSSGESSDATEMAVVTGDQGEAEADSQKRMVEGGQYTDIA